MPFLNNKKYRELSQRASEGDEVAKSILKAMRSGSTQDDINKMVLDFDNNSMQEVEKEEPQQVVEEAKPIVQESRVGFYIKLEEEVVSKLEPIAKANGLDLNGLVNVVLMQYIKEKEKI